MASCGHRNGLHNTPMGPGSQRCPHFCKPGPPGQSARLRCFGRGRPCLGPGLRTRLHLGRSPSCGWPEDSGQGLAWPGEWRGLLLKDWGGFLGEAGLSWTLEGEARVQPLLSPGPASKAWEEGFKMTAEKEEGNSTVFHIRVPWLRGTLAAWTKQPGQRTQSRHSCLSIQSGQSCPQRPSLASSAP